MSETAGFIGFFLVGGGGLPAAEGGGMGGLGYEGLLPGGGSATGCLSVLSSGEAAAVEFDGVSFRSTV